MPRIYAFFSAAKRYLCRAADGSIEFTTNATAATDIQIETPYDADPLTLATAAHKATSVTLLFPDSSVSTGQAPLHPKDNRLVDGTPLAASSAASQIGRRWTIRTAPDSDGYYICMSIAPDHTLAVSTTDIRPVLAAPEASTHRVFYEEAEHDGDYCESCDAPVEKGERWCCHGCRCDVEPGYERSYR